MPKIIKNGIEYNVDPNVVGATGLEVTTPEVKIIASAEPFRNKQLQYSLAHAYGSTQQERIQMNKRNANISQQYFDQTPTIGNIVKGAYYWLKSKPYLLGESESKNTYITGIAPIEGVPASKQLELFNQGRLALMQRYNNNPTWEHLAKEAGLTDDLVSSFRQYATKLLSTKQSPEPHLAPLVIRESPYQYSQSTVIPSKELPLKRYLDYKIGSTSYPHYTGVHEGAHMSTLNYDLNDAYKAYGILITDPKAKTAITRLMYNADKLADQLQVDPTKVKLVQEALIKQGKTLEEASQIIKSQIEYLKRGQEARARGLAAQEWIKDNHNIDVPQYIDNGINFFTNESLRNVWRNMAVGLPSVWGISRITQNNSEEK